MPNVNCLVPNVNSLASNVDHFVLRIFTTLFLGRAHEVLREGHQVQGDRGQGGKAGDAAQVLSASCQEQVRYFQYSSTCVKNRTKSVSGQVLIVIQYVHCAMNNVLVHSALSLQSSLH